MKKILMMFMILASFEVFAFDYHGIKSGMSKEEVTSLTGCNKFYTCSWEEVGADKVFNSSLGINPPSLWSVNFSYTSEGALWRIALNFREDAGAAGVAQVRALTELYPDAEPQSSSETIYSTRFDLITALIIDSGLFSSDVEKIYKDNISKY